MKRSTDRILTTHVGSLPRPDDLRAMIIQKQRGEPIDEAVLASRVKSAVSRDGAAPGRCRHRHHRRRRDGPHWLYSIRQ